MLTKVGSHTDNPEILGEQKLEIYGLDIDDAMAMALTYLSPQEVKALSGHFKSLPAIKIPYFEPIGKRVPMSGRPSGPPFYRLRYLQEVVDFQAVATKKKPQRYDQPLGSPVCAYFPTNGPFQWETVCGDPGTEIFITEGEFKAAKACKHNFPTIGLGGVYSFKSTQFAIEFLDSLYQIQWYKRHVYIVYDSDFIRNENIITAMNELAKILERLGAFPHYVALPDLLPNGKTGLDDFMVANHPDAFQDLVRDTARPFRTARVLHKINERFMFIQNPGWIIDRISGQKITLNSFSTGYYCPGPYYDHVLDKNGQLRMVETVAAKSWLSWPLRKSAPKITFEPGHPEILEDGSYNQWKGWPIQPKAGDATPFIELVSHNADSDGPEAKKWLMQWMAYPLQNPGAKMSSAVLICGVEHGSGKTLIGDTLRAIYGDDYSIEINQKILDDDFNNWQEHKQFIMVDDISGTDNRLAADILKKMVTETSTTINDKHVSRFVLPAKSNFMFTSNHTNALHLEDTDRRFGIFEIKKARWSNQKYLDYVQWLQSGGDAIVFHYLLNVDLKGFNPKAAACITPAKRRMIKDTKSQLGSFIDELTRTPELVIKNARVPPLKDLVTNQQILLMYRGYINNEYDRTTPNSVTAAMKAAGHHEVLDGDLVRLKDGSEASYFPLLNRSKWDKATRAEIIAYMDSPTISTKRRKF